MSKLYDPFAFVQPISETVDLEFKKAVGKDGRGEVPSSFFETYSAMANSHGGTVVFGVEERYGEYNVVGIVDTDKVVNDLWAGLNNRKRVSVNLLRDHCIAVQQFGGRNLINITIPRATRRQRPVFIGSNPFGGTYRRRHGGDYVCDDETVKRMLAEQIEEDRDGRLIEGFAFADLDPETFRAYRTQFRVVSPEHPWNALEDLEFLRCVGGWTRDRQSQMEGLTLAGLLMFGQLPRILEAVPNYVLDYQERSNEAAADESWLDRVTTDGSWSGNLYDFYRTVIRRLVRDLKVPFILHGTERRDETPVHQALREALVNTLIHSDYAARLSVLVLKRPGSFAFRNPGTMRIPVAEALRGGQSDCRNRKLQKMFQLAGLGEQSGSGIPRIFQRWKEQHWRAPDFFERLEPEFTILRMRMSSLLPDNVIQALDERFGEDFRQMSEVERLALATAHQERWVNHAKLKAVTEAHPSDISKALQGLVREGYLKPGGVGRGTFYFLPGGDVDAPLLDLDDVFEEGIQAQPTTSALDSAHYGEELAEGLSHQYENLDSALVQLVQTHSRVPRALVTKAILEVCREEFRTLRELANALNRSPAPLRNNYLNPMVGANLLQLKYPTAPNHPDQAYRAVRLE